MGNVESCKSKTIRVSFYDEDRGNCKTIFKEVGVERFYNKIESFNFNCWYTTYPSQGYFENISAVKDDVIFEIVDSKGNFLFYGNDNICSIGMKAKEVSKNYAEELKLQPHSVWRKWLSSFMSACHYNGYVDNWLYFEPKCERFQSVREYSHLGIKFTVIEGSYTHPSCDKKWREFFIKNQGTGDNEGICGYIFDDDSENR